MSGVGFREVWVPGRRQCAVFFLIALLGLGAWSFAKPAGYFLDPSLLVLDQAFDTGVILYALLALAAGFASPKGFYLWGIAVVVSHPFAALALTAYRESQGTEVVRGGAEGWVGFAFVLVEMTITTAMLLTTLSAAGAGLRLLSDGTRPGHPGTTRDNRVR